MDPLSRGLVRGLVHAPQDRGLRASILARGAAAIEPLIELLGDRSLWPEDAPGEGNAPVTAAELLGELRAADAVPSLLHALAELAPLDSLYSPVLFALERIGAEALDAVLALGLQVEADPTAFLDAPGVLSACCEVLAGVGAGDERVFEFISRSVRATPELAGFLAKLGDARALPLLHELAGAHQSKRKPGPFGDRVWVEVYGAIKELGEPTPSERARNAAFLATLARSQRW